MNPTQASSHMSQTKFEYESQANHEQQKDYVLRNRDHQRQSRARRKDYISDLESRIRTYEVEGVRITGEVQAAARKVADENRSLRTLLKAHGIDTAVVDAKAATTFEDGRATTESDLVLSRKSPQKSHYTYGLPIVHARLVPSFLSRSERDPELNSISSQQALVYPATPDSYNNSTAANVPVLYDEDSLGFRENPAGAENSTPLLSSHTAVTCCGATDATKRSSPDETDCETAARIIASMRGQEDPESLWPELGCSTERRSMVKHLKIFQMAS